VRANAVCPGWVTTPMADEEMLPLMQAEGLSLTEAAGDGAHQAD
jgi:NAD(P)-dependent dehydrogenase (short-subunit alcohol dehydrogenase family)